MKSKYKYVPKGLGNFFAISPCIVLNEVSPSPPVLRALVHVGGSFLSSQVQNPLSKMGLSMCAHGLSWAAPEKIKVLLEERRKGSSEVRKEAAIATVGINLPLGSILALGHIIHWPLPAASSNPDSSQGSELVKCAAGVPNMRRAEWNLRPNQLWIDSPEYAL